MDVRLAWTDCDEAGDFVVPYVLSPMDLVSRPDKMDKTVLHHTHVASETKTTFRLLNEINIAKMKHILKYFVIKLCAQRFH